MMSPSYRISDWRGHANTHCPYCSFATTSEGAAEVVDGHVVGAHPDALREELAGEMAASDAELRASMSKAQLLEVAARLGLGGLSARSSNDDIRAAIDAASAAPSDQTQETTQAAAAAPEED